MLDKKYWKPLYQLACEQTQKYGVGRSVVMKVDVNYSLYTLLEEEDRNGLTDDTILNFFFGYETELIKQKCLNPYWFWKVVKDICFRTETENPVQRAMNRNSSSLVFEPDSEAEAIAYGFMLWDADKKIVVRNPIFYHEVSDQEKSNLL